jgi:hypothetical protein
LFHFARNVEQLRAALCFQSKRFHLQIENHIETYGIGMM